MATCHATGRSGQHKFSCGCHRLPATTLSVLWLAGERGFIGHIGDTRIWRIRRATNGKAELLTTDHANWTGLFRCVGGKTEDEPDLSEIEVYRSDVFVLCSDGVRLDGDGIAEAVACGPPDEAARRVVEAGEARYAERRPMTDNASAVVVRVGDGP